MHGALARSRVSVTLPLVMASTYFTVPWSGTPVVGGSSAGFTGTPLRSYSQVAPAAAAVDEVDALGLEPGTELGDAEALTLAPGRGGGT